MADEISKENYQKLCEKFPLFRKIGYNGFGTKVWLVFSALNFKSVSLDSVASNPCQSLMQNEVSFGNIRRYLEELQETGILQHRSGDNTYALQSENAYALHQICYKIGNNLTIGSADLKKIILECGYTSDKRNNDLVNNFANGDVNAKTDTLKNILSQLAFAGAKFLIKCLDY